MNLEEERDQLRRELLGVQEILAFVLSEVGEPVIITKETLAAGLPAEAQISIEENMAEETFIISLVGK